MCTLTIFSSEQQCIVTMNRDELRSRFEEGTLNSQQNANVEYCYPVDSSSQGTWFGANNKGTILCLLNRYQESAQAGKKSRGIIIPAALQAGNNELIKAHLNTLEYSDFQAFDLIMIYQGSIVHYQWGGKKYSNTSLKAQPWFMLTSSYFDAKKVQQYRHSLFNDWNKTLNKEVESPDQILKGFHLSQDTNMKNYSILMEREHSHTKSIVQAHINKDSLHFKYLPNIQSSSTEKALLKTMQLSNSSLFSVR